MPPRPRTRLVAGLSIGLAALLLVAAGVFGFKHLTNHQDSAQAQQVDDITLRQVPGDGQPPKFGGTALHDACSVITADQLAALGVSLDTKDGITHEHLDGDVPADAALAQSRTDSASYCSYALPTGTRSR